MIVDRGKIVYSISWEVDSPVGSGAAEVFFLDGAYAVFLEDEDKPLGPYSSLKDAIAEHEHLYWVGEGTTAIESSELSVEEIESLLQPSACLGPCELKIKINGVSRLFKSY